MEKDILRKKIYSKIDELPTLPVVVTKLLELLEDKNSNTFLITEAIEKDPSLTSKVLKVANSAYYGFSQQITSLERAVALLGFNMVKSLVVSIGVMKNLPSDKKISVFSEKQLWHHSVTVAVLLREMGKRLYPNKDSEHHFITGLLHDIGLIVFEQFFNNLFGRVLNEANLQNRTGLYIAEKNIIGVDHGEVGGMLLTRWNFPQVISNPVTIHHSDTYNQEEGRGEIAMLRFADIISYYNPDDDDLETIAVKLNNELELLERDVSFLSAMIKFMEEEKDEIDSFFNAMI